MPRSRPLEFRGRSGRGAQGRPQGGSGGAVRSRLDHPQPAAGQSARQVCRALQAGVGNPRGAGQVADIGLVRGAENALTRAGK